MVFGVNQEMRDFHTNRTKDLDLVIATPGSRNLARRPVTLADLAVLNFIEMRDKTASKKFRAKKKLDHLLEGILPGLYLPLYAMVTFTRMPYAKAASRARFQDAIVYSCLVGLVLVLVILLGLVF